MKVSRLEPADARKIVDCFKRVYGESYANELFYDAERLAAAIADRHLGCVGAIDEGGTLLGHMAMTIHPGAATVELGNTVVDPAARGQGIAWQVGEALTAWCVELGYSGYLHYPTTGHHIMQRQSVKKGFEIGLMLGYIPVETDGKVNAADAAGRQAATIVYQPLDSSLQRGAESVYLASYGGDLLRGFAETTGLKRHWLAPEGGSEASSTVREVLHEKRALMRLGVDRVGRDLTMRIHDFEAQPMPCRQIDFNMRDTAIEQGVAMACDAGYRFCGWLPGYGESDVFRLQKVEESVTDMHPNLVNPVARSLLSLAS